MSKREADEPQSMSWPPLEKRKKKKSRWGGGETEKTFIPGMPTVIPCNLNKNQEEQYLLHLQIEEISRRLRTGDLGIPPNPEERSPSPEPIYNNEGKRLNTREYRTRKRLEEDRHRLIQRAMEVGNDYKPPADYKPPIIRVSDKVMIPQEEHPDINFVGLLIGPRGNTLKNLEKDTGAKIIIRGKGSVKEGKIGRKDGQPLPGEDEPLHAYVTANNPENVKKAVEKIKEIIKQGIEVPEGQNDLRRQQLRELALLNGTLRENDGLTKLKQLQQAQTIITNTIVCTVCGGTGHIAQDCKQKRPGDTFRSLQQQQQQQPHTSTIDKAKMDSEYMSLMAELGEGPPPPKNNSNNQHMGHHREFGRHHFSSQPPQQQHQIPVNQNPPWQQQQQQHQQQQQQQQPKPPSLMTLTSQPPASLTSQLPPISAPPPTVTTSANNFPPWQQQQPPPQQQPPQQPPQQQQLPVSAAGPIPQQQVSAANMGIPPPPPILSAPPPPPPPSTQPPHTMPNQPFPWQQQPPHSMPSNSMPMPPPPSMQAPPPWQAAPVPPPPPSNMPPWQQLPPPSMPNPVAPPPPPPVSQPNFNPAAPPPPPPGVFDHSSLGMPQLLGVPPPPPPN